MPLHHGRNNEQSIKVNTGHQWMYFPIGLGLYFGCKKLTAKLFLDVLAKIFAISRKYIKAAGSHRLTSVSNQMPNNFFFLIIVWFSLSK